MAWVTCPTCSGDTVVYDSKLRAYKNCPTCSRKGKVEQE